MVKIEADTEEMRSLSKKLIDLSEKYSKIVDSLFFDMSNKSVDAWTGRDREGFIEFYERLEEDFKNLGKYCKEYSELLSTYAKNLEDTMKNCEG